MATLDVLATIDTAALDPIRDRLAVLSDVDGLGPLLEYLLTLPAADAAAWSPRCRCMRGSGPDRHADVRAMAAALGERYPGDAGVVTALLLNLVHLKPGEALFLGAGNLHAYLGGTGVEIMANSDNVLRGGLTTKHRHPGTARGRRRPTDRTDRAAPRLVQGIASYDTPVPEFLLDRLDLDGSATVRARRSCCAPTVRSMPVRSRSSAVQRSGSPLVTGSSNCEERNRLSSRGEPLARTLQAAGCSEMVSADPGRS